MLKNKIIEMLSNKNIGIWGLGREGLSTLNFIKNYCKKTRIYLYDQSSNYPTNENNDFVVLGVPNELNQCDLIIKSPGVVVLEENMIDINKIISQTDIFVSTYREQIVGITGTKGKSTTTSLLYHILSGCLENVIIVGNIGIPCFDKINDINDETIIIFELSCHQLEFIKEVPHIGILLNVYQDHLDRYTFEEYLKIKQKIYKLQNKNDVCILPNEFINDTCNSKFISIGSQDSDIEISNSTIRIPGDTITINANDTILLGKHNIYNIAAAYYICSNIFKISNDEFKKNLKSFKGLKHRLEFVGIFNDIKYYNDSISTICEATIAALKSITDVDTLIIGGLDRGIDYEPLVDFINSSDVQNIILLPDTGERIKAIFGTDTSKKLYLVYNMEEAIRVSKEVTKRNKSCLLSPAAASYNSYKNFDDRGNHYIWLLENK